MRSCTQEIVKTVESLSDMPIHMSEDSSLQVDASIRIGNTATPVHLLRYRTAAGHEPDYYVAFQCGFVIRLYQTPPEKRVDLTPTDEGTDRIAALVGGTQAGSAPDRLRDILLHGLGTQLRSVPIGMRIDGWIASDYPDLKDLQEQAVRKQLRDNTQLIEGPLKQSSPAKVYAASISMFAAMAAYWARAWGDAKIVQPYKLAGFLDRGQCLLGIFDKASPSPSEDAALVEAWAFELGIKGWYRWVQREAPGR